MLARLTVILALGAALGLVAGCGDDDAPIEPITTPPSEEGAASDAPTKRAFINTADSRCAEANAAIANLASSQTAESLALVAGQERGITQGVLETLREIGEPDDTDGSLNRFYRALRSQVQVLGQRQQAAQRGDTAAYETLAGELAQAKADARVAAEEFGFRSCGQEGTAAPSSPDGEEPAPSGGVPEPAPPTTPEPVPPAPAPPTSGGSPGDGGGGDGEGGGGSGGIGAG